MREHHALRPIVVILFLVTALSFATNVRAEGKAACSGWLTAAEVNHAMETTLETAEPVEYSPGFTVCSWTKDRPEGQLGVNLSFFELKAIREGMVSAESIPEYFDLQVSSTQDTSGSKAEKLEGIGKRAVLFSQEYLWIVMIELEQGFVHLAVSPTDITRAQVVTLAKSVAAHAGK